jgi:hypothetical protein
MIEDYAKQVAAYIFGNSFLALRVYVLTHYFLLQRFTFLIALPRIYIQMGSPASDEKG